MLYNTGMKIGLYGGSFDPVHSEHVRFAEAALKFLHLDKLEVIPSYQAPHKLDGASASAADRLALLEVAFRGVKRAHVNDFECNAGGTSYTYLTCRAFREQYPDAELYLLVGADMLNDFFTWKNPDDILSNVTLAACGRGEELPEALSEKFFERFQKHFVAVPFVGEKVSSTALRVSLAFRGETEADLSALSPEVLREIDARNLYRVDEAKALELETPQRRAHSYRVALLACEWAHSTRLVPERKALLSAMLHDCAKYVPEGSPLLRGFRSPENVPAPVWHQYAGAYLAEHEFGVTDEEVIDAIEFHASGKGNMSTLGKLIYLSDLLESKRDFEGVETLRKLFWEDLDACMEASLSHQLAYLERSGKPVYPLTAEAFDWYKSRK